MQMPFCAIMRSWTLLAAFGGSYAPDTVYTCMFIISSIFYALYQHGCRFGKVTWICFPDGMSVMGNRYNITELCDKVFVNAEHSNTFIAE